jgi:hypothetical protein
LGENPLLAWVIASCKPIAVVRYRSTQPFNVARKASDSFGLLRKVQRFFSECPPPLGVNRISHHQMEPVRLGS